jgi:lipoyl(octanoyl) transferase
LSYSVIYQDIGLKEFKEAWEYQEKIFAELVEKKRRSNQGNITLNDSPGTLIFVEHPHVYTLGKNGSENNLLVDYLQLKAKDAAFYKIDRGGDITYHGPGQIVGYPVFDLEAIKIGLKEYIYLLEEAVIKSLKDFGLEGSRLAGGTGVWLEAENKGKARKICAIGVKVSRFITMHGFAFNINTDLSYFNNINPCGFTDKGVTSLEKETGSRQDMEKVKNILKGNLQEVFSLEWTN